MANKRVIQSPSNSDNDNDINDNRGKFYSLYIDDC